MFRSQNKIKMAKPVSAVKCLGKEPEMFLPPGWSAFYHECGGIIYFHTETRVVTWSRPYQLSKGTSMRKHSIPSMAIPCLRQKRELICNNGNKNNNNVNSNSSTISNSNKRKHDNDDNANFCKQMKTAETTNITSNNEQCVTPSPLNEQNKSSNSSDLLTKLRDELLESGAAQGSSEDPLALQNNGQNEDPLFSENKERVVKNGSSADDSTMEVETFLPANDEDDLFEAMRKTVSQSSNSNDFENCNKSEIINAANENCKIEKNSTTSSENCGQYNSNSENRTEINYPTDKRFKNRDSSVENSSQINSSTLNSAENNTQINSSIENYGTNSSSIENNGQTNSTTETNSSQINSNTGANNNQTNSIELTALWEGWRKPRNNLRETHNGFVNAQEMRTYLSTLYAFETVPNKIPFLTDGSKQAMISLLSEEKIAPPTPLSSKTPMQRLHEYCQRNKLLLSYHKLDCSTQQYYYVEWQVNKIKYGGACGETVKQTKHKAAEVTLAIIAPELIEKREEEDFYQVFQKLEIDNREVVNSINHFKAFNNIQLPFDMLLTLLKRYYDDFEEHELEVKLKSVAEVELTNVAVDKWQCSIICRELQATVDVDDKKLGKHLAAQHIIKQLYPLLSSWAAVMRLYNCSYMLMKQQNKMIESHEEDKEKRDSSLLSALHEEMRKIKS